MMLEILLAAVTLYIGDENALMAGADKPDVKTLAFKGETTDGLLKRIDAGLLKDVEADAVELFIGANNTRKRARRDETPLDTVLGAKDITMKLRARYPEAVIALNPIPYAEGDTVENRVRNYEINRAMIEINGKNMFLRQPEWMFRRAEPSKWGGKTASTTPYIKKYWLDNLKDPRLKIKRAEQKANRSGEWDLVMLGDSVTHFWELVNGEGYYNSQLRKNWSIFNLGFGGDATQNTIWNLLNAGYTENCRVKLFTILIGNNNMNEKTTDAQLAEIAEGCRQIVGIVKEQHPESKIVLFPLLPNETRVDGTKSRLHAKYNRLIEKFSDGRTILWAPEIWDAFHNPDGSISKDLLCDGCHPGREGYRRWGEILKKYLVKYCGRKHG